MPVVSSVTFLPVTNIERTYDFYVNTLNLKVFQKQGDNLYIFDTGYGYWGFCQYADGRKPLSGPQGVCLSLNLASNDEVIARYEELKDRCEIIKAPAIHPDFPVFSFFVRDPDGYTVEYQFIQQLI